MTDYSTGAGRSDDVIGTSQITQGSSAGLGSSGLSSKPADLKARAQEALTQGADQARYQAAQAKDYASQHFGQYQQQLTDKIVEKPLTSALVALGAGVVLGLALTGGRGGRD